jgi:hypothetical protein
VVQGHRHLADRRQPLGTKQVALGGGQRLAELPGPADPLQHLRQHLRERGVLGEVVVGPATEGGRGQGLVAVGRDHHHRRRMRPRPDGVQDVETGAVGQLVVEEDDGDPVLVQPLQRLPAAGGVHQFADPLRGQDLLDQAHDHGVVVDEQDAAGRRGNGHAQTRPSSRKTSA